MAKVRREAVREAQGSVERMAAAAFLTADEKGREEVVEACLTTRSSTGRVCRSNLVKREILNQWRAERHMVSSEEPAVIPNDKEAEPVGPPPMSVSARALPQASVTSSACLTYAAIDLDFQDLSSLTDHKVNLLHRSAYR